MCKVGSVSRLFYEKCVAIAFINFYAHLIAQKLARHLTVHHMQAGFVPMTHLRGCKAAAVCVGGGGSPVPPLCKLLAVYGDHHAWPLVVRALLVICKLLAVCEQSAVSSIVACDACALNLGQLSSAILLPTHGCS
jgi:hypothetical protein